MLEKLIVYVEEPSMETTLELLLPKILADADFEIRRFQCKDDLLNRDPDAILGGTWEALERVLKRGGYFKTGLRKMECARMVAQQMVPARNTSTSFQAFNSAVTDAAAWG